MSNDDDVEITKGMQEYIDLNNKYLSDRNRYIRDVVKKCRKKGVEKKGSSLLLTQKKGVKRRFDHLFPITRVFSGSQGLCAR